jgi:hypothetical protein
MKCWSMRRNRIQVWLRMIGTRQNFEARPSEAFCVLPFEGENKILRYTDDIKK